MEQVLGLPHPSGLRLRGVSDEKYWGRLVQVTSTSEPREVLSENEIDVSRHQVFWMYVVAGHR